MADVHGIRIEPPVLQLFGGPHSQPFGDLTAQVLDAHGRPVPGGAVRWSASDPKLVLETGPDPNRVTVGSYQPVHATVTARDPRSGQTATATVTVYVMDAGPPPP